jgi:hypothetical protein
MHDVLIKAAKTFVQAALASPLVVAFTAADITMLQGAALAGAAATISFLQNVALNWANK